MTQVIYELLNFQVTCIPTVINKLFGIEFNNAICNSAVWMFTFWGILHLYFDTYVYAGFKRYGYKPYICQRLTNSLWSFGSFIMLLVSSLAMLITKKIDLFNWKMNYFYVEWNVPTEMAMDVLIISTFYIHSSFWHCIKLDSSDSFLKYLLLFLVCGSSYVTRKIEILIVLTLLISITEISTNLVRILYCLTKYKNNWIKSCLGSLFIFNHLLWVTFHIIIIPIRFLLPLSKSILHEFTFMQVILLSSLVIWFVTSLYQSVLLRWFSYWIDHPKEKNYGLIRDATIEYSLFLPRNDAGYNLKLLRMEIKNRENEMISLRKPKSRGVLLQTIKCMLAIKRKRSEKKELDNYSESDNNEANDEEHSVKSSEKTLNEDHNDNEYIEIPKQHVDDKQIEKTESLTQDNEVTESDHAGTLKEGKLVIRIQKTESNEFNNNSNVLHKEQRIENESNVNSEGLGDINTEEISLSCEEQCENQNN